MDGSNLFENTADYYDLDSAPYGNADIAFYRDYAGSTRDPVLELACGTGRVSIPLARAGHEVVGLDLSMSMLSVFRRKLRNLPPAERKGIRMLYGDMADFELEERFGLVIVPFRGIQALTSNAELNRCLLSVRSCLRDDGLFIVDIFDVGRKVDRSWEHEERPEWTKRHPDTGELIVRAGKNSHIDLDNQVMYSEAIYYVEAEGEKERRLVDTFALRYYYQFQMEVLLLCGGFSIVETFGWYDRRSAGGGPDLIFVCRPQTQLANTGQIQ